MRTLIYEAVIILGAEINIISGIYRDEVHVQPPLSHSIVTIQQPTTHANLFQC